MANYEYTQKRDCEPVLSILIITHNQKELLQRCLKSVLEQEISVPYEVIVSDDRSADGTKEWIESLQDKRIIYTYCNSDECNPACTSERCAWNKLNAYNHAAGKYFVNIDADDYLRSNDIYQKQLDMLETNSECSMCMQQALTVQEGQQELEGTPWPKHPILKEGKIISTEDFFMKGLRGLNQTYLIRRHPEDDMTKLYGKWFDDTVITYHHLQYGPVVFLDRADYVWMQYKTSITHELNKDDSLITYGLLPIKHIMWIPTFKYWFLREGLPTIIHMLKIAPMYPNLSEQYRNYLRQFGGFLFRYYTSTHHSISEKMHYITSRITLLLVNKFGLTSDKWLEIVWQIIK